MNKTLGDWGERRAAEFLLGRGYRILDRNARSRYGEIDIIAQDGSDLVFVEVKARSTVRFGTPAESITRDKLARLQRLIADFVSRYQIKAPIRFEVVAIEGRQDPELITEIDFIDA